MDNWMSVSVESVGVSLNASRGVNFDNKPAVMLLHGFSDSGMCWLRVAEKLAPDYDVILPDLRNHGASQSGPTTANAFVRDIDSIAKALQLERFSLIGHSVGAVCASDYALAHPAKVHSLILEDPPWRWINSEPAPNQEATKAAIGQFIALQQTRNVAEIFAEGQAQHPTWDQRDLIPWADAKKLLRVEAAGQLRPTEWRSTAMELQVPTLLLFGADGTDRIVNEESAKFATSNNGHISSMCLSKGGHNLRRENFDEYWEAVEQFLGEASS